MSQLTSQEKITLYKNLFKGRDDVFAVRWEKADKSASGYTPVCLNEWKSGLCIKLNKGKCRDCQNQNYASINDDYLKQHLLGNKTYGIYPLLQDNTSYFLAADFDGENWKSNALRFVQQCALFNLPAYIERSRSGNGGHVWLFFTDTYPAFKSRIIAFNILKEANIIGQFEKEDSFDRLFPNQDFLSGKGFGNLIALPLQGQARKSNNTVFLDPENELEPYQDQWDFLLHIEKIPLDNLDQLYQHLNRDIKTEKGEASTILSIIIKEQIHLGKTNLPKILANFLKENLNFLNSEYFLKKRMGLSVYGIKKYFNLIQTNEDTIAIPRGFLYKLTKFLDEQKIKSKLIDERKKLELVTFESKMKLYEYQRRAVENMLRSDNGILVAPPGSGKTIIAIELITRLKQPSLILVHKKQIFNQWVERVENFLSIPKREIGQIGSNKKNIGDKITIAMVQTLNRMEDLKKLSDKIGMIIVDECHHIPARMFRNVITNFNPYYLYGLTATPERKNNDAKLIFIYLGDILHTIDRNFNKELSTPQPGEQPIKINPKIIIRNTDLYVPFKIKTDNFQLLSKIITFDSNRNRQIVDDVKEELNKGSKCLVLTERKEHVAVLNYYLKREYETIVLTGDLMEKQRKSKIIQIEAGHFQIVLATGQLIGEGTDLPYFNCLFLVYPFAFSGKLTQYIGRIQRGANTNKVIYDYRDQKIDYLEKFFKKRWSYYKKNFETLEHISTLSRITK